MKYHVTQTFGNATVERVYEVEAESEDDAREKAMYDIPCLSEEVVDPGQCDQPEDWLVEEQS